MNDLNVQYQGFHPSNFTREYLDQKLQRLLARSPVGANVRAIFLRDNEGITATLRILSSAGEFFAIAKGRGLKDVNRRLLTQARRQLQRWKERQHDAHVA